MLCSLFRMILNNGYSIMVPWYPPRGMVVVWLIKKK